MIVRTLLFTHLTLRQPPGVPADWLPGGWEVSWGGWVSDTHAAASAFLSLALTLAPAWPLAFVFALRKATNRSVDKIRMLVPGISLRAGPATEHRRWEDVSPCNPGFDRIRKFLVASPAWG